MTETEKAPKVLVKPKVAAKEGGEAIPSHFAVGN